MVVADDILEPSPEQIVELRNLFHEKCEKDASKIPAGGFHPIDLDNVNNHDKWLRKFLEHNDLDMKECLKQLWETCTWRKTFGVNEINDNTIRADYVSDGLMFAHGRDIDGKTMLIFLAKLYTRGTKDMDELKKIFVYWLERIIREAKGDLITVMFDMNGCGLSNMDMDYTKYMIDTMKYYYPASINYILVLEIPWILNAAFQLIKKLLPPKAVARLRFINGKTIGEYIEPDNQLKIWGGNDEYVFKYIPERRTIKDLTSTNNNNNIVKKVHFANLSPPESPMNESNSNSSFLENGDGEMLRIIPHNTIVFTKAGNELIGNVEIMNIDGKAITYKIKTTAPEKFRVRPSTGVLSPGASSTVNVVLQQGIQLNTLGREKFLVMCMSLGNDASTSSQELAELWKNTSPNSTSVEQHRLKCSMPSNLDGDMSTRNGSSLFYGSSGDGYGAGALPSDKQAMHMQQALNQLKDTTYRLEAQVKNNQTLQFITMGIFLILAIAIVYILKIEIKNSSTQSNCYSDQ